MVLVLLGVLLAACGSPAGVDKLGRPTGSALVLSIGAADTGNPYLLSFVSALARESQGRVTAQIDPVTYFSETAGGEARLAGDVRSGQVPIAFVPTRDWLTVDPRWQDVQASLLLTTTAASLAFAASDVAADMLAATADRGVVALALIPAEARRLLSREPIMSATDLRGLRIRINPTPRLSSW